MYALKPTRPAVLLGSAPVRLEADAGRVVALRDGASSTARLVALRSMLPLVDKDAAKAWVHLARLGEWKGHQAGEFAFTEKTFADFVRNFEAQANPVPITFEHPEDTRLGLPIPAAGWVHELRVDERGLWGLCEFTARAEKMIAAGEYRFCSVVAYVEGAISRETGEDIGGRLRELGLTNVPFIDGLEPIRI